MSENLQELFEGILESQRKAKEVKCKMIEYAVKLNIELWEPIKAYPKYEVSTFGRVRSNYKNGKSKELKGSSNRGGYKTVMLCKNSRMSSYRTHRLVAEAFLTNPYGKPFVDHINGIKTDNNIKNLRFATKQENERNRKLTNKNTSTVKGVSFNKNAKKWQAYIYINKRRIHIGYFNALEEAKQARQNKAREIFGEFLNECEL